jgi:hypothetical protein
MTRYLDASHTRIFGQNDDDERAADDFDDWVCDRCHGDGMDPFTDYLLPCQCQGEQKPSKEPTP